MHDLISARRDDGALAQLLYDAPMTARVFEQAACGPVTVQILAARAELPAGVAHIALQELITLGLVQLHEQADGRAHLQAAVTGTPVAPETYPGVPPRTVKIAVVGGDREQQAFITALCGDSVIASTRTMTAFDGEPQTITQHFGQVVYPDHGLSVFLSGTPQSGDYPDLWPDVRRGALGAVIVADTRRPAHAAAALTHAYLDGLPFVVAVRADAEPAPEVEAAGGPHAWMRQTHQLPRDVPVLVCEDQGRDATIAALKALAANARGHEKKD